MMRVLAIDPGCSTGWHCAGAGGHRDFSDRRQMHRTDRHALLFDRASAWVADLIYEQKPEIIAMEQMVAVMRGDAQAVLLGLRACFLCVCRRHEAMVIEIAITEWQAWARKRGWTKSDDENDARWLHDYVVAERLPEREPAA